MTVVSARRRAILRRKFRRSIHNDLFTVQVYIDESVVQPNPQIQGTKKKRYGDFTTFRGSMYSTLSGKVTRIFRNIVELPISVLGILDAASYMLQYVPDLYNLKAVESVAENVAASATSLSDSVVDFTELPIRIGAQVHNITDGSRALVTGIAAHVLTTGALTGGVLNLYTLNDDYEVCNDNNLRDNDKVFHRGKWRTVLHVIPDSEDVQTTCLLGD